MVQHWIMRVTQMYWKKRTYNNNSPLVVLPQSNTGAVDAQFCHDGVAVCSGGFMTGCTALAALAAMVVVVAEIIQV